MRTLDFYEDDMYGEAKREGERSLLFNGHRVVGQTSNLDDVSCEVIRTAPPVPLAEPREMTN